mmetsp:Transcript_51393/g.170312  ORF Transcript_51393/g.170312 Transcript_51393/m.170312 type:complete len:129 (-) Transcript_51393:291-677(-)
MVAQARVLAQFDMAQLQMSVEADPHGGAELPVQHLALAQATATAGAGDEIRPDYVGRDLRPGNARWVVPPESLAIMEQVFGMDHFPSRQMRSSIAVALSITPRQVACHIRAGQPSRALCLHPSPPHRI